MLKNILNLENVQKIEKKEQESITGGFPGIGSLLSGCSSCCWLCRKNGYNTGYYHPGWGCTCTNNRT